MIDKDFVQRKIALIEEEVERISEFNGLTWKDIVKNYRTQALVERLLERIIIRAIDVNEHIIAELGADVPFTRTYRETFLRLADLGVYPEEFAKKIAPSAGLRNALVHGYNTIDEQLLHRSIGEAMRDFNEYGKYILAFCAQP